MYEYCIYSSNIANQLYFNNKEKNRLQAKKKNGRKSIRMYSSYIPKSTSPTYMSLIRNTALIRNDGGGKRFKKIYLAQCLENKNPEAHFGNTQRIRQGGCQLLEKREQRMMKTEPQGQESSSPKEVYRTTNTVKSWFALEMNEWSK